MGLSIYYSGMLRNPDLIDEIITEAADIGDSLHWNITKLPSAPDIPVRGIILQPENCDPVWLTFHTNGTLCDPILFSFLLEKETPKEIEEAKYVLVTKTQYAGPETHMAIINFIRYLSEKYFSHFELNDDSKYWETGDTDLCRKRLGDGDKVKEILDLAYAEMKTNPDKKDEICRKLRETLKEEGYDEPGNISG